MKKNLILFLGAFTLALLPQKAVADQNIPDGLSIDTDYNETEPGYYYINVPFKTTTTLDLSQYAGVINAFKVYDEQGKDAQYTSQYNGDAYLIVIAPDGYIFHVTGTVTTDNRGNDFFRFYDGGNDWANRYRYKYCFGTHSGEDVGLLYTSGKEMCLDFHAWSGGADGLDLTVTLINTAETHDITVQPAAVGGSATASPVSAGASTSVSITATPDAGYLPNGFVVTDSKGHHLPVDGGWYSANTGTFKMPGDAVTVTPQYTNVLSAADGGLYINIPYNSHGVENAKVADIPDGIESFKVYDASGPNACYDNEGDGYLLMNAPAGKVLEVSGTVQAWTQYDGLQAFDGATNDDNKRLGVKTYQGTSEGETIEVLRSTGNQMLLRMYTQYPSTPYAGADLTVRVIDASIKHDIKVLSAEHGSVSASVSEAGTSEMVSLTVTPDDGYYLNDLIIKDEAGLPIAFKGGVWYSSDKTAHFQMPSSEVTVTPVFAATDALSLNMLVSCDSYNNPLVLTIPDGVTHFKLYDEGGPDGTPSAGGALYTRIKAPMGYLCHITGCIDMNKNDYNNNYLELYDGESVFTNTSHQYFYGSNSGITSVDWYSTGRYVFIEFGRETPGNRPGADLTVEFVPATTINLSLSRADYPGSSASFYFSSFYNKNQAFELPEEYRAFTVNSDHSLSLVGNGQVIPADCPVIIIGNGSSKITLTATDKTATPKAGNILVGVSYDTAVENVHVLYTSASRLRFAKFSGTIASGKAYINE